MSKKNNKALLIIAGLALLVGGAYGVSQMVDTPSDSGIIINPGDDNADLALNATQIKMKKVGDTFTLTATINADATLKSVTFSSSNPEAISITKINSTSVKLTKLKDFEDYITISATCDDPFVTLSATCSVRCYNNFTGFEYLYVNKIYDSSTTYSELAKLCDEDEIILKSGLTYECSIMAYSTFSYLNGETAYTGNTQVELEEDTMDSIRTSLTNIFGTLLSFEQDLSEFEANLIRFSFKYDGGFTFTNNTLTKVLSYEDYTLNITLNNYVAADIELNEEFIVL